MKEHQKALIGAVLVMLLVVAIFFVGKALARPADYGASATAYCLRGTMADGTQTRYRSAASNRHRLGTRITLTRGRGPGGLRKYVIRDRIGYGSQLDLWTSSCSTAIYWGRRYVVYRKGW